MEMSVACSDPLAVIHNENQWKINKVSPLYNMQYSPLKLKQYASKIRQDLVSAITSNAAIKYSVILEDLPQLKYSEDDSNSIMVVVKMQNTTQSKVAYTAILLSWGKSKEISHAVNLPYMLERGEQKIGNTVKSTLQKIFDCNINQYYFGQHHMLLFAFSFIECDSSKSTDPFVLRFKMGEDKVNCNLEIGELRCIWNGVLKEKKGALKNKEDTYTDKYSKVIA
ncbi:unnamed protein product [Leptidea sinapis]|uniref:Centromere protein L n=1 Tax=Leptidea sinapis TaxID=189913 RepID=A0A5E4QK08_9NEOP|nr:unnamed protein product [Leptidea sinapis]